MAVLEFRWCNLHDEADRYDREYRLNLTPEARLEILLQLIENYYGPSKGLERVYTITQLERS